MKRTFSSYITAVAAGLCAALAVPGAAWAGAPAAPTGIYKLSGQCSTGCIGGVTGTLNTTSGAASMSLEIGLITANFAISSNGYTSLSSVVIVPVSFIDFGPLTSYVLFEDLKTSYATSANYEFSSNNAGLWTLRGTTPPLSLAPDSPLAALSFSQSNSPDQLFTMATGTNMAFVRPPVPEPQSLVLLMAGLGLMGAVARRRQRSLARD